MASDVRSAKGLRKVVTANSLAPKAGSMAVIQDRPCQITFAKHIRSGKCGGASKIKLKGTDLLTGKSLEETFSDSRRVRIPDVLRQSTELVDIDEDTNCATVITDRDDVLEDVMLTNEEVREPLVEAFQSGALIRLSIMTVTTIENDERQQTHVATDFSITESGDDATQQQSTTKKKKNKDSGGASASSSSSSKNKGKGTKTRAPVAGNRMRRFYDKPGAA